MRDAISAGEPTRAFVWNRGTSEQGFWNMVALYPCLDEGAQGQEGTGQLRYYAAVSVPLSAPRMKRLRAGARPASARAPPPPSSGHVLTDAVRQWSGQFASCEGRPPTRAELLQAFQLAVDGSLGSEDASRAGDGRLQD